MPNEPLADLVTTREAGDILGLTDTSSVTRLVSEGKLAVSHRIGRSFLFRRADVEQLRAARDARAAEKASA